MQSLLIATTNPAKLNEYRLLLAPLELRLVSLREAAISGEPEESGDTFAHNAAIKARFYFERSRMAVLSDDGGLEVDALGGAPGVRSHRWLGEGVADDRALAEEVIRRMSGVPEDRRSARLRAAAVLIYPKAGEMVERVAEASLEGVIAHQVYPEIRPGFPYRAVLYLPERRCYLGELGDAEEAKISQRRIALEKLQSDLEQISKSG